MTSDPLPESPTSWRRDLLILTVACAVLFGFGLGSAPLANPDEGRYAEIPREMVARGDWVTPRLNDIVYFEKPPLVYWLTALCLKAFGPSEFSMRLVPALFALGGVLLTYAAGRALHGRRAGLAAAGVLATSLLYFALSRVLLLDMAVSVLMSATLFCFILAVRCPGRDSDIKANATTWKAPRRWLFYGLYASAALATLTKGLMGFLITGAVMFLWLLVFYQWRRLRPLYLPTGSLLFLAIAAPWHVLAAMRNETWAHFYFVHEHWERFTLPDHGKGEPWWYFIPVLLLGIFPWTGFLFCSVRGVIGAGWARRREHADAWFLITWIVFIFLFFSKSQSKIATYILPLFPALAVLIGAWLAGAVAEADARVRLQRGLRVFGFVSGLLSAALLVIIFKLEPVLGLRPIIKYPEQADALMPYVIASAVILILGGVLSPWLTRTRSATTAIGSMGLTTALFFLVLALASPDILRAGTRELALQVKSLARPGDRVVHYAEFFHDFTYYAERPVDIVAFQGELEFEQDPHAATSGRFYDQAEFLRHWSGPGRVFAVAKKDSAAALLADPSFTHHLLGETRNHVLFSNRPN